MKIYSKAVIIEFTAYVNTADQTYLKENGFVELMAVLSAIRGDDHALHFLLKSKQIELAAFVDAVINENKSAFKLLMARKCIVWAAVASIINGQDNAAIYLNRAALNQYIELAEAIKLILKDDKRKRGSGMFGL